MNVNTLRIVCIVCLIIAIVATVLYFAHVLSFDSGVVILIADYIAYHTASKALT